MKRFFILSLIICATPCVQARFAQPQSLPVDRLVKNTEAFLKEHPEDAEAYYILGRIHYLAFVGQSAAIGAFNDGEGEKLPSIAPNWMIKSFVRREWHVLATAQAKKEALKELGVTNSAYLPSDKQKEYHDKRNKILRRLRQEKWKPDPLEPAKIHAHADAAIAAFQRAIEINGEKALYWLGLASLSEQYDSITKELGLTKSRSFAQQSSVLISEQYFKAWVLAKKTEGKLKSSPVSGVSSLVGHEAGTNFIKREPDDPRAGKVQEHVNALQKLPRGAITPMVFSLKPADSIQDLLAPEARVAFDLDGDGAVEQWPWLKAETALLVWQPDPTVAITSGRQLFGSYSWQIFWKDGYAVLQALDDNRDGALRGDELQGMGAWFDRNQNGISEADEVTSLSSIGVESLATFTAQREGPHPHHPYGLKLKDGRTLPTWDWTVKPVELKR